MRLFRRSLLSLVAGVTAFGVAGWGLRPRANWSVFFGEGESVRFLKGREDDDERWVWLARSWWKPYRQNAVAYDQKSGLRVATIEGPAAFKHGRFNRHENGAISFTARSVERDRQMSGETQINLFDGRTGEQRLEQKLQGEAHVMKDGTAAWCATGSKDGVVFRVIDLASRRTTKELDFSTGYGKLRDSQWVLSQDERRLAVIKRGVGISPGMIEVWDVDAKRLSQTVGPPRWSGHHLRNTSGFRLSRRFSSPRERGWSNDKFDVDFDDLGFREDEGRPPPPNTGSLMPFVYQRAIGGGDEMWIAYDEDQRYLAFAVFRGRDTRLPWRRSPYSPAKASFDPTPIGRGDARYDEWIVPALRPPLGDAIPETLWQFAPASWGLHSTTDELYWHDWKRDVCRNVGCADVDQILRHGDALLTLRGGTILESWPSLPAIRNGQRSASQRFPWGGTWWMCARRYRRKLLGGT
jgi:hypothetical protein